MKKNSYLQGIKLILSISFFAFSAIVYAQNKKTPSPFWSKVQFGGGIGANFGNGFTNVSISPSAIYNFNSYIAAGLGLQGSYVSLKNNYDSYIYGASTIVMGNPVPEVQLSIELEQVRVNTILQASPKDIHSDFWNTGLYLGAGYRANNVVIGGRYNVLFDKNKSVYSDAFMPFIRVYF